MSFGKAARKEYAIWGIPKGQGEETLLMAKFDGEFITDVNLAKRLALRLRNEYGARKLRIQEIDMGGELDWMSEIGMKQKREATMSLRDAVIKLAAEKPELRKHLVPLLHKTAMEFDTQDALDKYLKEHPDADRSNHSVKKDAPKKEPSGKPAKMPPAQQKALKDTAKELDKSPRELLKVWNTERPHFGGAGPHRYEDGACVYCGRPKEYEPRGQSKTAMEFPTEEALKKYLKEHPDADRSKHHVVKDQGKAKPKDVTTGKGSGFGPHKKGPSVKSPKDVKEGDILLRESGGTQNVFKVTKAGPDFMEGHFVDPHDTKKKRLPSDQNQHVWDFAFGKEYSKAK